MASTTAPENRNMTPYVAVSRRRTVRRGSRERRGGRVVGTFLIASRGSCPLSGCLAGPNNEITGRVRAVLAPLPYNQLMDTTIEVSGVHKRFGPTVALDGMTFTVQPGRVTGFVGPNGAGKSTTMRVILGLDAPDEGSAAGGRTEACGIRCATSARCLTRVRCSQAAPGVVTCCGWPIRRA